jgi:hypothetical protein
MPHVARNYERHMGHPVGDGHCVALVRECAGLPSTTRWRRGVLVRGVDLVPGTCIATFDARGRYPNTMSGDSHAAILLAEEDGGLRVCDQWRGQHVHERIIRFKGGHGLAVNDGDRFWTIELADDGGG